MNKYLVIFIKSGLFFGLAMGALSTLRHSNIFLGALNCAISGLLFGGFMAVISYISQKRLKSKGISKESKGVNQRYRLIVNRPLPEVRPTLGSSVSAISNCKIVKEDADGIKAKTGMGWKSFGEQISIFCEALTPTETLIEITSSPSMKTTLVDYGRNLENVEAIGNYFKHKYINESYEYT